MKWLIPLAISFYIQSVKAESLDDHMKRYYDCFGRVTEEAANIELCKQGIYGTNNAILWSGEMAILQKEVFGEVKEDFKLGLLKNIPLHFSQPGLLSRHPDPYRFKDTMKVVSFDEYTGIAFMASVIPEFRETMDEVVEYGMNNNWQFWDLPGYEKGRSWFNLFRPSSIKDFYHYLQEDSLRKSTVKYPSLYPLFATHHFHQRIFYKMMSKSYNPSSFENFMFAMAGGFAADSESYSQLSMWIFRYKALEHIKYKSWVIDHSKKYFKTKLKKRFGKDYESVIFAKFYENKDHPFHRMIKETSGIKDLNYSTKDLCLTDRAPAGKQENRPFINHH